MRGHAVLFALLVGLAGPVRADCVAASMPTRPHLIELYSSEGCSSCPPAEAWLLGLRADADAVPLEFHVDYWDALGWPDRFADARYTVRQQQLAALAGSGATFTPQVLLDGRNWGNWYRGGKLPSAVSASAALHLSVEPKVASLHARVEASPIASADLSAYRTYLVLIEDGLVTEVKAGENRGRRLRHDHVVRAYASALPLTAEVELPVAADVDLSRAALVAFVQNPGDGAIAQVLRLPLAQCRP